MDFSFTSLAAGFVYGVIGFYLVKYAKKEGHFPSFFIGIALMIYPYFFANPFALWGIGAALSFLALKLIRG